MTSTAFEQLHPLLDKHADKQLELIDTLAQRVQMLGGVAIAEMRHMAEVTTIPRPDGVEEIGSLFVRLIVTQSDPDSRPT